MIRQLALLAVAAICLMASTTAEDVTDKDLGGLKEVWNILLHIYRNAPIDPELLEVVKDWNIDGVTEEAGHEWKVATTELSSRYKLGMLKRGQIFSIYHPHHLNEAVLIFKALYHAPTLRDLVRLTYWAHRNLNEHQFNHVLAVVLLHRHDTKWIPQERPYRFYPEYFFNSDVMKQIYDLKMELINTKKVTKDLDIYVVEANYTNWYITNTFNPEYNLTYFTEDLDLNSWYYYYNQRFPFWISSKEYSFVPSDRRGEIYYYTIKTFLNRYYMERLSNGLGEVEYLNWDRPIKTGYSPYMTYTNGMHFPQRKEWSTIPICLHKYLAKLREFESRITDVADSGLFVTKHGSFEKLDASEGFNTFANFIQGNNDSLNKHYYGSVDFWGRRVLGFSPAPYNHYQVLPSALEHFSTSLRDPGFYRLYNKINSYFSQYKERLGPYKPQELAFEGVKIDSVNIIEKNLITYFEEVANLVDEFPYWNANKIQRTARIMAHQYRLNHKPFTWNINISSKTATKACIRIFIGPKYDIDGKEIGKNYKNFVEIDYFVKDLKEGENNFQRKSTATPWLAPEYDTTKRFEKIIESTEELAAYEREFGFPGRLLLPKGSEEGMPFQFFVYVSKYVPDTHPVDEPFFVDRDNKALGFPLDRPIWDFTMSNMKLVTFNIFHEKSPRINL